MVVVVVGVIKYRIYQSSSPALNADLSKAIFMRIALNKRKPFFLFTLSFKFQTKWRKKGEKRKKSSKRYKNQKNNNTVMRF